MRRVPLVLACAAMVLLAACEPVLFHDDFDRADAPSLGTIHGVTWENWSSSWTVEGDQARPGIGYALTVAPVEHPEAGWAPWYTIIGAPTGGQNGRRAT